jgi:hypothetical protein
MNKSAVNTIGFWSALLAFVFSITITIGAVVGGMLPRPWDAVLPVAPSLLLAPTFAVMMVAVYHAAPEDRKIWGHVALVIAILYASIASIVYVTWLFVLEPHVMQGTESRIQAFAFGPGTFLQMLDGMAYFYSCLAAFSPPRCLPTKDWSAGFAGLRLQTALLQYRYFFPMFTLTLRLASGGVW